MALGDESFYTITGEEINRAVLVQIMIDSFNEKYPDAQITDFNEGSQIRNTIESIACEVFHMELHDQDILRACFLSTSYGNYLDLFGLEYHTPRDNGEQSRGIIKFSIPEATTTEILIPAGTTLMDSETGMLFDTTGDTIISIGDTNTEVSAISRVIGEITNSESGKITLFTDTQLYPSVSCTNESAFTGGRDKEDDDTYRARLLAVKAQDSFGSKEHYIRLGESVPGVHDVLLVDKTGYTAKVLVNPVEKPLDEDILAEVTGVYTTESNLVYKQNFYVAEVDYTEVDLEVVVSVTDEVDEQIFLDLLAAVFDGGEIISATTSRNLELYYPGLRIDEELTNYQLLTALSSMGFVVQVTSLTSGGESFEKLTPDTNEVLVLGTVTITQNVVS